MKAVGTSWNQLKVFTAADCWPSRAKEGMAVRDHASIRACGEALAILNEREKEKGDLHACMQMWTRFEERRQPLTYANYSMGSTQVQGGTNLLCCAARPIWSGEVAVVHAHGLQSCSSLPLAHLIDGTHCWENTESHSMHVLLPVVENGSIVLPVGELAGQVN
jgi:hypothetical protein